MKQAFPLKTCPWCNQTPKFKIRIEDDRWFITIKCEGEGCSISPSTKVISIRKTQRLSYDWIFMKIKKAVDSWNSGNLEFKNEGFYLDIEQAIQDFKDGKVGKPGFMQDKI